MEAYILGGGVAAGLVGVIVGLWYKIKYGRVCHKVDLLRMSNTALSKKHEELKDAHNDETSRLNGIIENHVSRGEEIREKVRELRTKCDDPAELNDELNRLLSLQD